MADGPLFSHTDNKETQADGRPSSGSIFWSWQPNECHYKERLHRGVAADRHGGYRCPGDPFNLGALVCARVGVTVSTSPRTIYDFGGFPQELFQVQYLGPRAIPRSPVSSTAFGTAQAVNSIIPGASTTVHGPCCDTFILPPTFLSCSSASTRLSRRLSILISAGRLAPLRDAGVLIVGSGNIVHNLHTYAWGRHMRDPYDWALRFERAAKDMMLAGDHKPLINYETLGPDAALSIPTPDHYLPLLYVAPSKRAMVSAFQLWASMGDRFQCWQYGLDRFQRLGGGIVGQEAVMAEVFGTCSPKARDLS